MAATLEARTVSIAIGRDWREVYDFVHRPENLPRWASGAAKSLRRNGDDWIAEAPEGRVRIRFTERNDFGVLDHHVIPATGAEIYIPVRVIANEAGAEVMLTLFRLPEMSDAIFARDAEWVARDLAALKALLES